MDLKRYVEEVEYVINTIDLSTPDAESLYRDFELKTQGLARELHVARITVEINIVPSVLDLDGGKYRFDTKYQDTYNTHVEAVLSYEFNMQVRGRGVAKIYPKEGYFFDMDESDSISSVARLTYMLLSRAMAVRNLKHSTQTDMLTGLANTGGIREYCDALVQRGVQFEYASIFFSFKNFKLVNRRYGVRAGDQVIRQVADKMHHFVLDGELAGRPGGDNFFVCVQKERLGELINAVSSLTAQIRSDKGEDVELPIPIRIGIFKPDPERDQPFAGDMYLENASIANNLARRKDLGDVVEYQTEMIERMLRAKQVASMFPEAFRKKEFIVYYQPMVDAVTGKMSCGEALIRWMHNGQLISPGEFIPVAESEGIIESLDLYVAEQACSDLRAWIDAGIDPVRISINLSTKDLEDAELAMKLQSLLEKYRIDGKFFEVELTETAGYNNLPIVENFINTMHESGVQVSMDDFGTGYSSLSLFMKLNFDIVKLDRSFISKVGSDSERDLVVLKSVIAMLHDLKLRVVAEGVETQEQLDYIRAEKCDLVQGFYYDRPLPHEEFTERLKQKQYNDH